MLEEGEDTVLIRAAVDRAHHGDKAFLRFCVDRLVPRPQDRGIDLDLPANFAANPRAVLDSAMLAMAAGKMTAQDAIAVVRFLHLRRHAVISWRRDTREQCAVDVAGFVQARESSVKTEEASRQAALGQSPAKALPRPEPVADAPPSVLQIPCKQQEDAPPTVQVADPGAPLDLGSTSRGSNGCQNLQALSISQVTAPTVQQAEPADAASASRGSAVPRDLQTPCISQVEAPSPGSLPAPAPPLFRRRRTPPVESAQSTLPPR
jgi:hypothetical protein